jgi:hypothetical protein
MAGVVAIVQFHRLLIGEDHFCQAMHIGTVDEAAGIEQKRPIQLDHVVLLSGHSWIRDTLGVTEMLVGNKQGWSWLACHRRHIEATAIGTVGAILRRWILTFMVEAVILCDMPRDFFDPAPEQQNVVLSDAATLQKAQRMIAGCEACSEDAEIPFDNLLDRLTDSDPSVTDYVLQVPGRCLQCGAEITEKTLVECNEHGQRFATPPRQFFLFSDSPEGAAHDHRLRSV